MTSPLISPIPWVFVEHSLSDMWVWKTPHFEARVLAEPHSFVWTLTDFTSHPDGVFLAEEQAITFAEAETGVRETVGKSYPTSLGYGRYVGNLATTFTLATGERVDFSRFVTEPVIITVTNRDGTSTDYTGMVKPHHYELHLKREDGQVFSILPAHIASVVTISGRTAGSVAATGDRSFTGQVVAGCNGEPGFRASTVSHFGVPCPIHER